MSSAEILVLVLGTLVFLAIGSFTCVVIDRLPVALDEPNQFGELWDSRPWGEVLGGRSRCSSCGSEVGAINNIPLVSWLLLRGRCKTCGESIPAFHPLVELTVPALYVVAFLVLGFEWTLIPVLWLIPVGVAVAVIDLRTLIVPTRIVWPALFIMVGLSVVAVAPASEWDWLLSGLVGLAVFAGPLFVLWFAMPRGMGFGDVRLATLLGFALGFYAQGSLVGALFMAVLSMGASAGLGILLGLVALGARGRKAKVPFGPAMVAGTFICIGLSQPILDAVVG